MRRWFLVTLVEGPMNGVHYVGIAEDFHSTMLVLMIVTVKMSGDFICNRIFRMVEEFDT